MHDFKGWKTNKAASLLRNNAFGKIFYNNNFLIFILHHHHPTNYAIAVALHQSSSHILII